MVRKHISKYLKAALLATLVVFSFGAAGEICGTFFDTTAAAFGSKFPDNKAEDVKSVLDGLGAPQAVTGPANTVGSPLAVLVTDESPRALVGIDLAAGREIWKVSVPIQSELTIGGNIVVFQSGYSVVGVDLRTGATLWSHEIETGWNYHGADIEGDVAIISVGVGGEETGAYSNGQIIALNARTGNKLWENSSGGGLLGAPAIHGNFAFVPWDRQKITIIDIKEGTEVCRVRADDFTINFVRADATGAYYGTLANGAKLSTLYRLDEKSTVGTSAGSTSFVPALEPVPGEPAFARDAFALPVAGRSGTEKIKFHWLPAIDPARPIGMADGAYYLHYWRFIIAFDQTTHQVRWTYRSERDIESMAPVKGGVVGVNADGKLFFVDAVSGGEIWTYDSGHKVLTAAIDANGFRPAGGGGAAADPLIALKEVIWDKDNRMLPIRSYAAFLIAAFPAPEVTQDLLTVYSDASCPKGLRDSVVQALRKRTTGAEYLVKALHMKYDFLEQTQAPPMGVVAPALVNMGERAAVSGLLDHLMDHETAIEDLREIALAIRELGDQSVVGTLNHFVTLYHADSSFLGHEDAIATAAEGILKFGGQPGETYVAQIRDDTQTLPELKSQLLAVLDPEAAAKAAAEALAAAEEAKKAAATAEAETAAQAAAKEEAGRPYSLTVEQINGAIATNQEVLKPCVQAALGVNPMIRQIRLKFALAGATGQASNLQILPADVPGLLQCLSNGLATISFPRFKNLRQPATYIIQIQGQAPPAGYTYPVAPDGTGGTDSSYDPDSFGGGSTGYQPQPQPQPQYPQYGQPQYPPPQPQPIPPPQPQPPPKPKPKPQPVPPPQPLPMPQPQPVPPPQPPAPPGDPDAF